MKRTVGRWTAIQNTLPKNDQLSIEDLWDLIERRTWGKRGYSQVAIKLTKAQEKLCLEAETHLAPNEEHRA